MACDDRLLGNARPAGVHCTDERLIVACFDGRELSVPVRWYPRRAGATPQLRADRQLAGAGYGMHRREIDEDRSVEGLPKGWAAPGVVT